MAVLLLPVVLLKPRIGPDGGVVVARGVDTERKDSAGGVVEARGVAKERLESAGGVAAARGVATGAH